MNNEQFAFVPFPSQGESFGQGMPLGKGYLCSTTLLS